MNNLVSGLIAFLALCVLCAMSAPAKRDDDQEALLQNLRSLADTMESLVDRLDSGVNLAKRQGAWDMDYGWGGGRFGKRTSGSNSQQGGAKRYDMYGLTGRFGRDVARAQAQLQSNDRQ